MELHANPGGGLNSPELVTTVCPGARIIAKYPQFHYIAILISPTDKFGHVTEEQWTFIVGKYAVCQQWLTARFHVPFSGEDITCFLQILDILREIIALKREIDHVILTAGKFPLAIYPSGSLRASEPSLHKAH